MGGCLSDVSGGKQAVGGTGAGTGTHQYGQGHGHTDAIDHFFRARGQYALFTQIGLSFSGSKLCDRDILSKSDPMLVAYLRKGNGKLEELGRTEVILNSLEPIWVEKISVAFHFEIVQYLVFCVYDVDTNFHKVPVKAIKLNDQEFLGEASCMFGKQIVSKQSRSSTLKLQNKNGQSGFRSLGSITVHAEEVLDSRTAVEITLRCSNLENKEIFSKSDPFLRISRAVESGDCVPICKTEVLKNNLNPIWKPICLSMQQFGSKENPLVIECFDFNSNGNHVLMSKLQISVAELKVLYKERRGVDFYSHRGHGKGQLFVDHFVEKQLYSFLDYISSGFELNFMVAVDFTRSNGDPKKPNSLHYIDPSGRLNSYQQVVNCRARHQVQPLPSIITYAKSHRSMQPLEISTSILIILEAIKEVGEVIQFYDDDRRFPAWGFGAKTYKGHVSHCFNLNGSANDYEVAGVEGIMAAYASALHRVTLHGPTLFGPVINKAAEIAARFASNIIKKYFVLLIITDGVISDIEETKNAIVNASDLPLSILIVGVGGADFTEMEVLDADDGRRLRTSTGRVATRDIVQFVPMRKIHRGEMSVVQALLEELPGQFLSYMRARDIKPLNYSTSQCYTS